MLVACPCTSLLYFAFPSSLFSPPEFPTQHTHTHIQHTIHNTQTHTDTQFTHTTHTHTHTTSWQLLPCSDLRVLRGAVLSGQTHRAPARVRSRHAPHASLIVIFAPLPVHEHPPARNLGQHIKPRANRTPRHCKAPFHASPVLPTGDIAVALALALAVAILALTRHSWRPAAHARAQPDHLRSLCLDPLHRCRNGAYWQEQEQEQSQARGAHEPAGKSKAKQQQLQQQYGCVLGCAA